MSTMVAQSSVTLGHNLYFAVQPAAEERHRIADLIASLRIGGVPVRLDRLHITTLSLVHDDVLPAALAQEAAEIAASISMPAFRVVFDRLVGGNRSALLLPSEPLEGLRMFRERLGFALMRAGIPFRQNGKFTPHMTLLYGGQPLPEQEIEPISWLVEDVVLIDTLVGGKKHVEVGRWPLSV